jgi:hypothetical protein
MDSTMPATEAVLLACLPRDGGPVLTVDATLDLESGNLAIAAIDCHRAFDDTFIERFIRLKGHPARFPIDRVATIDSPQFRLRQTQLELVRAALADRGLHPCAFASREQTQ